MKASWTGYINVGLLNLAVGISPAAKREDVTFKTLNADTGAPIKQAITDSVSGVEVSETRKGFEYASGAYVMLEKDELERFAAQRDSTVKLSGFCPVEAIPPHTIERTYFVFPHGGGTRDQKIQRAKAAARPYWLLHSAMEAEGLAGHGTMVMSTKEYPVALRAHGGFLYLDLLFWADEVRPADAMMPTADASTEEIEMARGLLRAMAKDGYCPRENDAKMDLLTYLHQRAAGDTVELSPAAAPAEPVIDLMAALKASMAAVK